MVISSYQIPVMVPIIPIPLSLSPPNLPVSLTQASSICQVTSPNGKILAMAPINGTIVTFVVAPSVITLHPWASLVPPPSAPIAIIQMIDMALDVAYINYLL